MLLHGFTSYFYICSLILWFFPIGPGVPVFPIGPGVPVFVYIIIGVVILAVFLLFLCTFLVFLSKHLYRRWQIQNSLKVSKPL